MLASECYTGAMDEDMQNVPIDELRFTKHTETLPAPLVNRITLVYYVFRDYLSPTLNETIENFKYDKNPEKEVEIWEHMGQVVIRLKAVEQWPTYRIAIAVKAFAGAFHGCAAADGTDRS